VTELKNVKALLTISLSLLKGEIREGSRNSAKQRTHPNPSLRKRRAY